MNIRVYMITMRKLFEIVLAGAMAVAAVSCVADPVPSEGKKEGLDVFQKAVPDGYYQTVNVSVPAGTRTVYIEYKGADGHTKTVAQAVKPVITTPEGGKDAEPFGAVALLLKSAKPSQVNIYFKVNEGEATKASSSEDNYILVENLPVNLATSGEFGKTRYVRMPWNYAWENREVYQWHFENVRTYPADVVLYDAEHNHTLRYKYAYSGVSGEGYMLDEAYEIVDHEAVAVKYNYCGGCGNCQFCMPWGCSCGCGGWDNGQPVMKPNPDFVPNGNLTEEPAETPVETPELPENVVIVDLSDGALPEPAGYITEDGGFTNYHSSGVVMFEDKWPNLPEDQGGKYNMDFNDVVVDYDVEATVVSDELLEKEGWREQVKVVLHLRAVGGDDPLRVGMALENFNTDYVQSISEHKTLDSWQNPHGNLPQWLQAVRFQENSVHYDHVSNSVYDRETLRPAIEIGQLQAFNGKKWDKVAGKEVYQYKDDRGRLTDHVMNPALRLWDGWKTADKKQYAPELENVKEPYSFAQFSAKTFYNTIPGFVNVAGGLYTYTVIYHMKPRAEMTPQERAAAKQNMIDAVYNTTSQNFFIVKGNWAPVGLKGYKPLDYRTRDNHVYSTEYDKFFAQNAENLVEDIPYVAKNGQVWAFKAPVLTRHLWEMNFFANAYPHYHEFVESQGQEHQNWYNEDVDYTYLSCEW